MPISTRTKILGGAIVSTAIAVTIALATFSKTPVQQIQVDENIPEAVKPCLRADLSAKLLATAEEPGAKYFLVGHKAPGELDQPASYLRYLYSVRDGACSFLNKPDPELGELPLSTFVDLDTAISLSRQVYKPIVRGIGKKDYQAMLNKVESAPMLIETAEALKQIGITVPPQVEVVPSFEGLDPDAYRDDKD